MIKNTRNKYKTQLTTPENKMPNAESLEQKISKMLTSNEPIITDVTPIFTEKKDGVLPQYDIRTDRFEIALDANERILKSQIAAREKAMNPEPKTE